MKKRSFPSAQSILLMITVFVAILTWIIPSGKFDTLLYDDAHNQFIVHSPQGDSIFEAKQETLDALNIKIPLENFTSGDIYKAIAIPATYQQVQAAPQGIKEVILAPVKGIIEAADIIFMVLIIGGLIGIMNRSGAFTFGIQLLVNILKGKEYLLIILTTTLVALGGTTFGFAEETIAFFPILIPIFMVAGYDAIVAIACIFMGSAIGTMCSTVNPFSTIIASDSAGINWTTGLTGRIVMLILCLTVTLVYILYYAKKVKSDPSKSIVYDQSEELKQLFSMKDADINLAFSWRTATLLVLFALSFIIMIIGVSQWGWWFTEMIGVFFAAVIIIGFVSKMSEGEIVDNFSKGAGELLGVAFIIGIARGVSILMTDGMISDTILYHMSTVTEGLNKGLFINLLFGLFNGLSFFIPSSSGMAVLSMPIIAPLADTVDIGREHIVNAYQYGMGTFYIINPTGLILASLAVAKLGFDKWLRFIWPLFIALLLVTMIYLTISVYL